MCFVSVRMSAGHAHLPFQHDIHRSSTCSTRNWISPNKKQSETGVSEAALAQPVSVGVTCALLLATIKWP